MISVLSMVKSLVVVILMLEFLMLQGNSYFQVL